MRKPLTKKQDDILKIIREHPFSTIEELGEYAKLPSYTVYARIKAIKKKGYITNTSKSRSIRIVEENLLIGKGKKIKKNKKKVK